MYTCHCNMALVYWLDILRGCHIIGHVAPATRYLVPPVMWLLATSTDVAPAMCELVVTWRWHGECHVYSSAHVLVLDLSVLLSW